MPAHCSFRGAPSDANKVLLDSIPINDIGGGLNLSYLRADGMNRVEFQRGPNSALYGSDALASVVSLHNSARQYAAAVLQLRRRWRNVRYLYHQDGNVGGYWKRLDYFADSWDSDNKTALADSQYHRPGLILGNSGWQITPNTTLRGTVDRAVAGFNSANAVAAYGDA